MISDSERTVYERMQQPLVVFSVSNGALHAELISDGLCSIGTKERTIFLNQLNNDLYYQVHPDDKVWMKRAIDNFILKMCDLDVVYRNKINNGDVHRMVHAIGRWQEMQDGSEVAVIAYYDMMEPEGKLERLFSYPDFSKEEISLRDKVTGLSNISFLRQFSNEQLHRLRLLGNVPVLLCINVRTLHEYNTRYGYFRGDELMRLYASLVKEFFPNAMVCRGADSHFIVLDAYTNEVSLLEKIKKIDERAKKEAYGTTSGIHVGICLVEKEFDVAEAVDCARMALKEISNDLSTLWKFYSREQDEKRDMERYVLDCFDKAISGGWIKAFYQGIVSASTEELMYREALARWIDPEKGMISPAKFIPVLSHYHLMHKLDLYMIEQICRDFCVKVKAGLPTVPVSVNLSAQDFDHIDVAEKLNELLDTYGISHDRIMVEITEQDMAQGTEHFTEQIKKIHANGYKLWIDDFGSGYNSLDVFSKYDIDQIKFDMELLRHLNDNNGANRRVLKALMGLCHELGIRTLVEGVETHEQLNFLKEIGCDMCQGFLFYQPVPVEEM